MKIIKDERTNVYQNFIQLKTTIEHFSRRTSSASTTAKARQNKTKLQKAIQDSVRDVLFAEMSLGLRDVFPEDIEFNELVKDAWRSGSWEDRRLPATVLLYR